MNAPSVDIKDILAAESSLNLTYKTNLFIGKEEATPSNVVTIFDTPGWGAMLFMDKTIRIERPAIQIRVRNRRYTTGWNLLDAIRVVLQGRAHETWNGARYELIVSAGVLSLLDWDENTRPRFILNFDLIRQPSTNSY